jgi:SH3 domain protein
MRILFFIFLTTLTCFAVSAQTLRYITDEQRVPLRSGPGTDYRIIHSGLPSGTTLELVQSDEASGWSEVRTQEDLQGWTLTRYLVSEKPSIVRLTEAQREIEQLREQLLQLRNAHEEVTTEWDSLREVAESDQQSLEAVNEELERISLLSSNAIQLDQQNRRLIEQTELMHTRLEMLEADNRRLQENRDQEAFVNGALAVLLGAVIAVLAPRLWPRRRRNDGWA